MKLLEYRQKWKELEADTNPFALATMAFLKTVETQGHEQERYHWKKYFLLELYRRGLSREMIVALYDFIGIVMALPEANDEALYHEIKQTSEEAQMSLLDIAERVGKRQGVKEAISDILEIKFGVAGLALFNPIEQIKSIEALEKLRVGLKQAQSPAEAEALIRTHADF